MSCKEKCVLAGALLKKSKQKETLVMWTKELSVIVMIKIEKCIIKMDVKSSWSENRKERRKKKRNWKGFSLFPPVVLFQ